MSTTRTREEVERDLRDLQATIIAELGGLDLRELSRRAEANGLAAELRAVAGAPPVVKFPATRARSVGAGPEFNDNRGPGRSA